MPQAVRDGVLQIGEIEIECAVLEDGTRVLSERALTKGFGGKRGGAHWRRKQAGEVGADLPVFLSAKNISSNLPKDLVKALTQPVMYRPVNGGRIGHGVEATLLPKICTALMDLRFPPKPAQSAATKGTTEGPETFGRTACELGHWRIQLRTLPLKYGQYPKCLSYGVPKGSPAYVQCRTQLDQNRAAIRASERFGNAGGMMGAIERATQN